MCGRYSLATDYDELQGRFGFDSVSHAVVPLRDLVNRRSYNIAPTQPVLALRNGAGRRASLMRWGLVPSWAKSLPTSNPLINARAETVAERPSFRTAFTRRRCLIPADGFYAWRREGRVPMRAELKSREPFAFAGLWEAWRNPSGG